MSSNNASNLDSAPRDKSFSLRKLYLISYNSVLTITWTLVFLKSLVYISEKNSFIGLYHDINYWLRVSQAAAALEVIHSLIGLVKSSMFTTLMQVASRYFVLFGVVDMILVLDKEASSTVGFPLLLFCWTVTEIIRYSYYANQLMENDGVALQWCRYTFFIVLYPLGVTGEILCILASIPVAKNFDLFTYSLPSPLNISFDYASFCYSLFFCYSFGFYSLYTHMFQQRSKIIGGRAKLE